MNTTQNSDSSNVTAMHDRTMRTYPYYPPYYNLEECYKLNYTVDPMYKCENTPVAVLFGMFVGVFGFMSIFGNMIMPIVVWKRKSMRTKQNYIKASLALNDMIVGFILIPILPYMVWYRNSSEHEIRHDIDASFNSTKAKVAASALIITLQGSLLHLMFLSFDRFIAIKWPMMNRRRKKSTVVWTCVAIWLIIIAGSVVTALFEDYFNYIRHPTLLLYTLGYESDIISGVHGYVHFVLALFFPYVITIVLTVLTAIVAMKNLNNNWYSSRPFGKSKHQVDVNLNGHSQRPETQFRRDDSQRSKTKRNSQSKLLITILIMTGAFVLAWSIFFVMFFASIGVWDPKIHNPLYFLGYCAGLSNSIANVIIYSMRDGRFRAAVRATFFRKNGEYRSGTNTVRQTTELQCNYSTHKKSESDDSGSLPLNPP